MESWASVRLGELLKPVSRPERLEASKMYKLLGARWYAAGMFHKATKPGSAIQASTLYRIEEGDFVYSRLFAWKGSFAIASSADDGCFVSNEFPSFHPHPARLDPTFLRYYFSQEHVWLEALGLSSGSTPTSRNRLKESQLLAMNITLPPLEEQQRIVARVETLAAKIEEARGLRSSTLEYVGLAWSAGARKVFDQLMDCPTKLLSELVSIRGGGTPSKGNPEFWGGDIPWISPKDMKKRELSDSQDHVTEAATQDSSAKLIDPGAVLIVVRGMILVHTVPVAVLRRAATVNQDMKALIVKDGLLPEFLAAWLWAYNPNILDLVEKSTHDTRKLETHKLLSITINIPSVQRQREIVAQLDVLKKQIDELERLQETTQLELEALLPSILSRAFAGAL